MGTEEAGSLRGRHDLQPQGITIFPIAAMDAQPSPALSAERQPDRSIRVTTFYAVMTAARLVLGTLARSRDVRKEAEHGAAQHDRQSSSRGRSGRVVRKCCEGPPGPGLGLRCGRRANKLYWPLIGLSRDLACRSCHRLAYPSSQGHRTWLEPILRGDWAAASRHLDEMRTRLETPLP